MNKLIEKYNKVENVLLISSYPEKGVRYSQKDSPAIGGFAKNTIDALKKTRLDSKYIILTIAIDGKQEVYEENGNLVIRLFERNNLLSFIPLIKTILKFNKVKSVLTEFEFSSWGNIKITSLLLLLFAILRLLSKKQILILHQMVTDLKSLNGHLGWSKNDIRSYFYNLLLKIYYKFLVILNSKIVVTEEIFKRRLAKITGNKNKIITIPHGVDSKMRVVNKNSALKKLGLPRNKTIVLYFGYLSWYKGADLFFKYAKRSKNKNYYFIMAGGPSFTNAGKNFYKDYLQKLKNPTKNLRITGFVHEDQIPFYFSVADIVVLPYRTMMSSSGPLSLAFSFNKPVLLSNKLQGYIESRDFKDTLENCKINKKDMFFSLKSEEFYKKIKNADLNKLRKFSESMRKKRNYLNIVQKYNPLLFQEKTLKLENRNYLRAINEI